MDDPTRVVTRFVVMIMYCREGEIPPETGPARQFFTNGMETPLIRVTEIDGYLKEVQSVLLRPELHHCQAFAVNVPAGLQALDRIRVAEYAYHLLDRTGRDNLALEGLAWKEYLATVQEYNTAKAREVVAAGRRNIYVRGRNGDNRGS